jgi:hypothetical protein
MFQQPWERSTHPFQNTGEVYTPSWPDLAAVCYRPMAAARSLEVRSTAPVYPDCWTMVLALFLRARSMEIRLYGDLAPDVYMSVMAAYPLCSDI